jgi:hypothetical protein
MLLPDFPVEFWSAAIFKEIANSVGKFIYFDSDSLRWCNKQTAWVLVEFEMDMGLPASIEITIGDRILSQPVDYWKESFPLSPLWITWSLKGFLSIKLLVWRCKRNNYGSISQVSPTRRPPTTPESFLGKMAPFFPSFFSSLSDKESIFLRDHEKWVQEIFENFGKY